MRFVEDDYAVEVLANPFHDLINARKLATSGNRLLRRVLGEHVVRREQNAVIRLYLRPAWNLRLTVNLLCVAADALPFFLGRRVQRRVLRNPNSSCPALIEVVGDDAGCFARLTYARAIANQNATTKAVGQRLTVRLS